MNKYFIYFMMMIFFMSSCLMFSFNYKHLLLTLISLEFMMINCMYLIFNIFMNMMINPFFLMFIMTLFISEGIIGLSIFVYMIRTSGNDYSMLMKTMKW